MAIYHLSVKFVSRKQGRSPVAAAAYRAGEKLHNKYDGLTHDYTNKRGIVFNEILLPDNAPKEFSDRETLWNAVEFAEKRRDARTAREVEIALPNELSTKEQIELVRQYVADNFTSRGMCADVAIHAGKHQHQKDQQHEEAEHDNIIMPDNPHAHILVTTRPLEKDGFLAKKDRTWEHPENVRTWRKNWADAQNKEFERKGLETRVSHERNIDRGIDREPTIHLGHTASTLERKGIRTELGNKNRAIRARNKVKDDRDRAWQERRKDQRERAAAMYEKRKSARTQEPSAPAPTTPARTSSPGSANVPTTKNRTSRTKTYITGRGASILLNAQAREEAKTRAKARAHIKDIKEQAEKERRAEEARKAQEDKELRRQQIQQEIERRRKEQKERAKNRDRTRDKDRDKDHDHDRSR